MSSLSLWQVSAYSVQVLKECTWTCPEKVYRARGCEGRAGARETSVFQEHLEEE